ncbi:MAG: DUF2442 domain-containing protein, partial [Verrucomicrobiota bacterium]|nr:DUF2442 domain-containing protein [Verrucomicrobiota bacterium]
GRSRSLASTHPVAYKLDCFKQSSFTGGSKWVNCFAGPARYSGGAEGEIDLSEFANKKLFAAWKNSAFFQKVHGGPYRLIRWNDEIELRPDSFYMKLTGETAEQFSRNQRRQPRMPEISRFYSTSKSMNGH